MKKKKIGLQDYRIPFFRVDDLMFALGETDVEKSALKCRTYVIRMIEDIDKSVGLEELFPESSQMNPHKMVIKNIKMSRQLKKHW